MRMVYDCLVLLALFYLIPKHLWDRWVRKKPSPTLAERLGLKIPDPQGKRVIWIHAISVGETKAAQPLFQRLKAECPDAFFLITHVTVTGHQEAKRSLSSADAFAFLPWDLSWIMRRWAKKLRPTHFLLIEGDFWFNQLRALKKVCTKLIVISGKISEKSASRFAKVSFFARRLFGLFDLFCVQSEEYRSRFAQFVPEPLITGNIKFDAKSQPILLDLSFLDKYKKKKMTLASTHTIEEKLLLEALKPFFSEWTIFLAPRHLERLKEIKELLHQQEIPYICWSCIEQATGLETIILIDSMGQLPNCYVKSELAIVGGSFVDHVGGHNVLEPCLYGCPSLFGPHTYSQIELTSHVLREGAGLQLNLDELRVQFEKFFRDQSLLEKMKKEAKRLSLSGGGVIEKTFFFMKEKSIWK